MPPTTNGQAKPSPTDKTPAKTAVPGAKTPPDKNAPAYVKPNRPLGAITALAFSPDGKKLAVGTYGQVVLYDTTTWQQVGLFRQVEDSVRALAFHPDGQLLAIGSGKPGLSGQTLLWDTSGAQKPRAYPPQQDTVEALAFSKDGKQLLLGANDNKARYFTDLASNKGPVLDAHNGRVQAVAFSPKDGSVFVTGAMDKIVKVWDEQKVQNVINFDQSEGGITGLAFLPNGTQFVGASLDGRLYWWGFNYDPGKQTYSGYQFRTVNAHPGGVFALGASPDGKWLITGGADSAVGVWSTERGGRTRNFTDSAQPLYAVAISPDGKTAAAGGREGLALVWDVDANKFLTALAPPALPAPPPPRPTTRTVSAHHTISRHR